MKNSWKTFAAVWSGLLIAVALTACGAKPGPTTAPEGTAAYHVLAGEKLLAQDEVERAEAEFNKALQKDPAYAPAHTGKGLALAGRGAYEEARKEVAQAIDLAAPPAMFGGEKKYQQAEAHVAMIRVLSAERAEGDWISKARKHYADALALNKLYPAAHYYMGLAEKRAYNFERAGEKFQEVLQLNTEFVTEATQEWRLVQDIQLADPESELGKETALAARVSRAQLAALFVRELGLVDLYKNAGVKASGRGNAKDIAAHPLLGDIEQVLKLGVRGLEAGPRGNFRPDESVAKADFAVMIEDVLVKVGGDADLATRYIGDTSPFPDVSGDAPYFNAVMAASSKQILGAKDLSTAEYAPQEAISGALALLAIRKLKDTLRF